MTELETLVREVLRRESTHIPDTVAVDTNVIERAKRRRSSNLVKGLLSCAFIVVVLVGIVNIDSSSTAPPRIVAAGQRFPSGPSTEPKAALPQLDGTSESTLAQSQGSATQQCMRDAGWDYEPPPVHDGATGLFLDGPPVPGPDELRSDGYRDVRIVLAGSGRSPAIDAILAKLSPDERAAWETALSGAPDGPVVTASTPDGEEASIPTTGCTAHALVAVYGDLRGYASLQQMNVYIGRHANRLVFGDPEYLRTAGEWRTCIADHGIDASDLIHTGAPLANGLYRDLPKPEAEIQVGELARADADCQDATGLDTLRTTLWQRSVERIAQDNHFDIDAASTFLRRALDRAEGT